MLPPVSRTLFDDPSVASLIGKRIYRHGSAPQGVQSPYVTWSAFGVAENGLSGACADVWRVQIDCWSDTDAGIEALAAAARAAMEPKAHLQSYDADERNEQTKRYRITMSFDWIASR